MPKPQQAPSEKPKNFKDSMLRLVRELGPWKKLVVISFTLACVGSFLAIFAPNKISELTDIITAGLTGEMDFDGIKAIAVLVGALFLTHAVFDYFEAILMTRVANNFARSLRARLFTKTNRLPLSFFDKNSTGDLLSRVTNDIDTIAQTMNQSASSMIASIAMLIGTTIMMFVTNWVLALVTIFSSLIGFALTSVVLKNSQKYFVAKQRALGKLNGHIEETYSSLNVVKAYNGAPEMNKKFDTLNENIYKANKLAAFLSGTMPFLMNFATNFGYFAVTLTGALLTAKGYISFGTIIAFVAYLRYFSSPLSQIASALASFQSCAAASERVFEILDTPEMTDESALLQTLPVAERRGAIEFKDVVFTYEGNDHPTVENFSVKVAPGQKIAIVGPTGAGKTTMVNLLMKFYNIDSGDIIIDGHSIHDLSRTAIHDLFTMVLQDTWTFDGTIKENIAFNRPKTSQAQITEVCKFVGLDHFVRTLPSGYHAHLTDSNILSAGQKQLLTISRAMLKDAPFLILDEATSNVDTRTEELVQKSMDKLTEGRTSFIIAHRLSTIKNADLILVMKDGNIIEQGNHAALMAKNGFYADLYNSQFAL